MLRTMSFTHAFFCAALAWCAPVQAQNSGEPTNDLPNPYTSTAPWGTLPAGQSWGAFNGVAIDKDGESVWVASRCGANPDVPPGESPFQYDSCAGSPIAPVMKFDAQGKLQTAFGAGLFIFPHKVYVDADNNVWVVDGRSVNERERKAHPTETGKGHTVVKFSPQGKVLLTLGKPGVAGQPPDALTQPNSVVVAPNGNIFIAMWPTQRGIRVGNVQDGKVLYRIPDPLELKGTSAAEGLAVDARGNVFGGEVGPRQLVRHAK